MRSTRTFDSYGCVARADGVEGIFDLHKLARRAATQEMQATVAVNETRALKSATRGLCLPLLQATQC